MRKARNAAGLDVRQGFATRRMAFFGCNPEGTRLKQRHSLLHFWEPVALPHRLLTQAASLGVVLGALRLALF